MLKPILKSVTGWESSFFGGYYRMILDHPRVFIDDNIEFDPGTFKGYISYYEKEKILKIFLSKTKKGNFIEKLLDKAVTTTEKNFFGNTVNKTTIAENSIESVLNGLSFTKDDDIKEYLPLFDHYSSFIKSSKIYFKEVIKDAPPPPANNNQEEEKQENKSLGSGNGKVKQDNKENKKEENKEDSKKSNGEQDKKEEDSEKSKGGDSKGNSKQQDSGNGDSKQGPEKGGDSKQEDSGNGDSKQGPENSKEDDSSKSNGEDSKQEEQEKESKPEPEPESKFEKSKKSDEKTHLRNISNLMRSLYSLQEEPERFKSSISGFSKKVKINHINPVGEPRSSKSIIDNAEALLNLLDISFENTSDIVKNLRIGKLDIAKIAEVPAGNIAVYKQEIEDQATRPFSIVILCDESGSMRGEDKIEAQYEIVRTMYLCFSQILPQDKIFVYGHTGYEAPELFVYQDPFNLDFEKTIVTMINGSRDNQSNYDGIIIEEVYNNVRSFTSDRIIFIVLSDGQPAGRNYGGFADIEKMKQIIEKCKRDEFVTVGVGIQYFSIKGLYQYNTVVNDLSLMPKQVSNLLNTVVKTEFQ